MPAPREQVTYAQRYGSQYGVDPRLLLAIGGHETHWGTLGAGRQGYTLGYGATDSGTISKYAGAENQYRWAAQTLAKWGAKTLQDVLAGKAGSYATDPHWEQGVANAYKGLGGALATPTRRRAPDAPLSSQEPRRGSSTPMPTWDARKSSAVMEALSGLASGDWDPTVALSGVLEEKRAIRQQRREWKQNPDNHPVEIEVGRPRQDGSPPEELTPNAAPILSLAKQYIGTPYKWGGMSPKTGFDCSGFVQWLYKQQGISIPRVTYTQIKAGKAVDRSQLAPGDIVFFGSWQNPHHEGLYLGGGQFIHAPQTGDVIKISSLADRSDYVTARRVA